MKRLNVTPLLSLLNKANEQDKNIMMKKLVLLLFFSGTVGLAVAQQTKNYDLAKLLTGRNLDTTLNDQAQVIHFIINIISTKPTIMPG